jgi:hypothetical protein
MIDEVNAAGLEVICPNNLPIRSIGHAMKEHEHADHPDYKFPVEVEWCGCKDSDPAWYHTPEGLIPATEQEAEMMRNETHALIYCDGNIAITLYEHSYSMFYLGNRRHTFPDKTIVLSNGLSLGGFKKAYEWKIKKESLDEIKIRCKRVEK